MTTSTRMTRALGAAALAATAIATTASPAMADPWRGGGYYRHHGGDGTGAAIAGGIVGLALGAAIAGSDRHVVYRERYYEPEYYPGPAYYPAPVYYPAPAYYPGYYGRPYYARPYYYQRHYWHRGW